MFRAYVLFFLVLLGGCHTFFDTSSVPLDTKDGSADGGDTTVPDAKKPDATPDVSIDLARDTNLTICEGECPCAGDCRCDGECTLVCQDSCSATCSGAECSFVSAPQSGAQFECLAGSDCAIQCVGACEVQCTDKDAECFTDCVGDSPCLIRCGTERLDGPPPQRLACEFTNCEPFDCGGGVFVCGRECP